MLKIDSHQHFWNFNPVRDSWIDQAMSVIQKDFLPADLQPVLQENHIDGCITVQSDQSEEENAFQLANAEKWDFIKGVVGWVDLQADNLEERLEYYSRFNKMKGFRHVLQGEVQRDFMLRPAFMRGVAMLQKFDFTYDILIYADQLDHSYQFVRAFPDQPFVIDHLAKPNIRNVELDEWKKGINKMAACKNVYCKVSGMVTEANWKAWKKTDFVPYLDMVTAAFGTERLLFGSDWPVCLVAASYTDTINIVNDYFSAFSKDEQGRIFGGNAANFYNCD